MSEVIKVYVDGKLVSCSQKGKPTVTELLEELKNREAYYSSHGIKDRLKISGTRSKLKKAEICAILKKDDDLIYSSGDSEIKREFHGSTSKREKSPSSLEVKRENKETKFEWLEQGSLILLNSPGLQPSDAIAGFDLDSTIIKTKSGRTFAKDENDWKWFSPEVPEKLRLLSENGMKVVIFTNQNGISTGKTDKKEFRKKVERIITELGIPIQVFVATKDDLYRKPSLNMWTLGLLKNNGDITPNLKKSFYIGDAAGRPKGWNGPQSKKDFSASDLKFAKNLGIKFETPEEFFLGQKLVGKEDTEKKEKAERKETKITLPLEILPKEQELVLFVGFPASGKSTYARTHFIPKGYAHVNQDKLKTKQRCLTEVRKQVKLGVSVVVDNTNPSSETRAEYLKIAQEFGLPVRCYYFKTSEEEAKHLNIYREKLTEGEHKHVPRIAYNLYKKNFVEPKKEEGFTEVRTIEFIASFATEKERELYNQLT